MKALPDHTITNEPELFEVFKDIEAINKSWLRVHTLLKAQVFQHSPDREAGRRSRTDKNRIDALSFALMGFLWCKGTKEEKADYLFDVLMGPAPSKRSKEFKKASSLSVFDVEGLYASDEEEEVREPILVWTSQMLPTCFERLFQIAIDLP